MNLYEIYTTLRRRGMPGHWRLEYAGVSRGGSFGYVWRSCGNTVDPSDAQDLLTMHALRWANDPKHWPGGRALIHASLQAILAATEHLEPKNA